jgi:hypothetical protein
LLVIGLLLALLESLLAGPIRRGHAS